MTDALPPLRFATVFLVDARGWILLQERDEHAPIAPERWGMVGGHVEEGEEMEAAAYRELAEETGLHWDSGLTCWFDGVVVEGDGSRERHFTVWAAAADLHDDDIIVGEGRQIVFVDPDALEGLPLSESTAELLPLFLASDLYAGLRAMRWWIGGSAGPDMTVLDTSAARFRPRLGHPLCR